MKNKWGSHERISMSLAIHNDMQPDDLKEKLFALIKQFAVEKKEVILASGQTSDVYIDCRQIYFRGEAQFILGELFYKELIKLEASGAHFHACGGMALGAIPLSCALSLAAFRRGREMPGFTIRKESKNHGMMSTIEGNKCLIQNDHVLVLEDVVTSGGSVIQAIARLRENHIFADKVLAIVDREQGAKENLSKLGVTLHALFKLKQFIG
jgi:orotate phosphoribosyltransferase